MPLNAFKVLSSLSFIVLLLISCDNSVPKIDSERVQNPAPAMQTTPSLSMDDPASLETELKTDSLNTELRLRLAAVYYTNKDFEKAISHYLIVTQIDKENMAALFNLGNAYYDTEQNEKAIIYYEKFLKLDKSNSNARCDLATCYLNINNPAKAISLLRENIRINNNHPQSHYNLSVILKQTGKIAEADTEMEIYKKMASTQSGMMP